MAKYQKEHVNSMCFVTDILCFIIWLLQCSVVCGVDLLMEVGQLPHHGCLPWCMGTEWPWVGEYVRPHGAVPSAGSNTQDL